MLAFCFCQGQDDLDGAWAAVYLGDLSADEIDGSGQDDDIDKVVYARSRMKERRGE